MDSIIFVLLLVLLALYAKKVIKDFRYLNSFSRKKNIGKNLLLRKKPYRFLYGKLYYPVLTVVYEIYDNGIYLSAWFLNNYFLWKDFDGILYTHKKLYLMLNNSKIVFFDSDAEIILKLIPKTLVYR